MSRSHSGEAEKCPTQCTGAGAGGRAERQRAGKTSAVVTFLLQKAGSSIESRILSIGDCKYYSFFMWFEAQGSLSAVYLCF